MDLIIRGGTIVSHLGKQDGDIAIKDGKIAALGDIGNVTAKREIDAKGKIVIPGGIDTHTHHENPFMGCEGGDDFYTGSVAAACGGTTTMLDFSITPRGERPFEFAQSRIKKALDRGIAIDFSFHCSLTEVNEDILADVKRVIDLGLASFKVYMIYRSDMLNDGELMALLEEATKYGGLIGVHAENAAIAEYRTTKFLGQGKKDWNIHPQCKPNFVEYEAINRAVLLATELNTAMFIFHMSTGQGAELCMKAREEGKPVYSETCAHYLTLTDEVYDKEDGYLYLISPPLRKEADQEKLWEAISKRAIYTTGSDHAPFTHAEKEMNLKKDSSGKFVPDFTVVANGAPGIEMKLPTLIRGVSEGRISWEDLVYANSYAASRVFGMYPKKGEIIEGADADIAIVDPNREVEITGPEVLHMHCDHTPYIGRKYKGWPETTILRGNVIVEGGEFIGQKGYGQFVKRKIDPEILKTSRWE